MERDNAQLVFRAVRGCKERYFADYLETYSPVVRIETARLQQILAHLLELECFHVGFFTAFLNGVLVRVRVIMKQLTISMMEKIESADY